MESERRVAEDQRRRGEKALCLGSAAGPFGVQPVNGGRRATATVGLAAVASVRHTIRPGHAARSGVFAPLTLCLIVTLLLCLAGGPYRLPYSITSVQAQIHHVQAGARSEDAHPSSEMADTYSPDTSHESFDIPQEQGAAMTDISSTSVAEAPASSHDHATGEAPASAHGGQGETMHSDSIPLPYKLFWVGAISMVLLLIGYFFYLYKKEKYRMVKPLTFLLLFLALSLYLMEQGRVFTGYFNQAKHLFVPGYHEANDIGFLRFLYKLTLGIALCAYGFIIYQVRQKKREELSPSAGVEPNGGKDLSFPAEAEPQGVQTEPESL